MNINPNNILIRLAYAEDISGIKRYDGNISKYHIPIKNELDNYGSPKIFTEFDGLENYKIILTEKIYILDSEDVPVKSMSARKYLQHDQMDEDGPIRGWIILDLVSKYGSENLAKHIYPDSTSTHGITSNVFHAFDVTKNLEDNDPKKQKRKFIFTTYENIQEAARKANIEIKINASLDGDNFVYEKGIIQEARLGSLMPHPNTNNSEINFIGKINFIVNQLEIFNKTGKLETDQKLYDHFISKYYKLDQFFNRRKTLDLNSQNINKFLESAETKSILVSSQKLTHRDKRTIQAIFKIILSRANPENIKKSDYFKQPIKLARIINPLLKDGANIEREIIKLSKSLNINNRDVVKITEEITPILMHSKAEGKKTKKRKIKRKKENSDEKNKKYKKQRTKKKPKKLNKNSLNNQSTIKVKK